jgi:hypothetical protein
MPRLAHLDQATGLPVRRVKLVRHENAALGDLVHVEIKKQGRIPYGSGHRKLGRTIGDRNNKMQGRGYSFLHHVVDDHSRLTYSDIFTDENNETAAGFWISENGFFENHGNTVKRVLTYNGSSYRSDTFTAALCKTISHKFTRPYRTQTNGKVERFKRTLAQEWA